MDGDGKGNSPGPVDDSKTTTAAAAAAPSAEGPAINPVAAAAAAAGPAIDPVAAAADSGGGGGGGVDFDVYGFHAEGDAVDVYGFVVEGDAATDNGDDDDSENDSKSWWYGDPFDPNGGGGGGGDDDDDAQSRVLSVGADADAVDAELEELLAGRKRTVSYFAPKIPNKRARRSVAGAVAGAVAEQENQENQEQSMDAAAAPPAPHPAAVEDPPPPSPLRPGPAPAAGADGDSGAAMQLPANFDKIREALLEGPFVLKVEKVDKICSPPGKINPEVPAAPKKNQYLKMTMTDDIQHVIGFVCGPVRDLDIPYAPGHLRVSIQNVLVSNGVMMIVPDSVEVIDDLMI